MRYKDWLIGSILLVAVDMPATVELNGPMSPEVTDQFQWSLSPEEIDIPDQFDLSDEPSSSLHLLQAYSQENSKPHKLA
jgi:hypothetical protein